MAAPAFTPALTYACADNVAPLPHRCRLLLHGGGTTEVKVRGGATIARSLAFALLQLSPDPPTSVCLGLLNNDRRPPLRLALAWHDERTTASCRASRTPPVRSLFRHALTLPASVNTSDRRLARQSTPQQTHTHHGASRTEALTAPT